MRTTAQHTTTLSPAGKRSSRQLAAVALSAGAALVLGACADSGGGAGTQETQSADGSSESAAAGSELGTASLSDADGGSVGEVTVTEVDGGLELEAQAENLEPGFYGLHVHAIGECEPDSSAPDDPSETGAFLSAGSHIAGDDGAQHPEHAGDLPSLLVNEDGTASMTIVTDRLDESLLLDDDGSALMVHADPDNFANIPERYAAEGADEDTTSTGDAGSRLACGVVEAA